VTPPPPAASPRAYAPPKAEVGEEPTCLAETIASAPNAGILLRNTCPLRVNFALCVRRSDEDKAQVTKGSLSPAAVYAQDVPYTPKTQHFTHRANFCPGLMCEVAVPDC
ncbi:MAG: hypothetical protein JWO33_1428, partial [Caulobacteraceae bacterium]|nr:hypothetical protein [Caulobacteraceae bacterium]